MFLGALVFLEHGCIVEFHLKKKQIKAFDEKMGIDGYEI